MKIKDYWNQRASEDVPTATTKDTFLRVLEREVLSEQLRFLGCNSVSTVLDLGCGDGNTVEHLWREFGCTLTGLDFSPQMIHLAEARILQERAQSNISFLVGDIINIDKLFKGKQFDFVLTDRCLINLESANDQFSVIRDIAEIVRDGGYYLAVENFLEGNNRLNELRQIFQLPPISVRWHNRYFKEQEFIDEASKHFEEIRKEEFSSSYYFATRVIYSKFCQLQGAEPDYLHPIHELSVKLPKTGDFSPIKLFVMRKKRPVS
ncbi:MAG: class I SAM-dependent methyltransferase [Desulfomonilaceae bacterium]